MQPNLTKAIGEVLIVALVLAITFLTCYVAGV